MRHIVSSHFMSNFVVSNFKMLPNDFTIWLLIILQCGHQHNTLALLFPVSSVLQIVGSISVPVEIQSKDQRLFFDWGLQMNYMFPYNLSSFYNAPIWSLNYRKEREVKSWFIINDYSTEEIYESLTKLLKRYNYDESCLERAMCELAQHPFNVSQGNMLSDLLHLILTPTLHSDGNSIKISTLTKAELLGSQGGNCSIIYVQCKTDLLNFITRIMFA